MLANTMIKFVRNRTSEIAPVLIENISESTRMVYLMGRVDLNILMDPYMMENGQKDLDMVNLRFIKDMEN